MRADGSDRQSVVDFVSAQVPGATVLSSYPIMYCAKRNTLGFTVRFKDTDGAERRWNLKEVRGSGLEFASEFDGKDHRHSGEWVHKPPQHGEINGGVLKYIAA